jgi:hypothetical protein
VPKILLPIKNMTRNIKAAETSIEGFMGYFFFWLAIRFLSFPFRKVCITKARGPTP